MADTNKPDTKLPFDREYRKILGFRIRQEEEYLSKTVGGYRLVEKDDRFIDKMYRWSTYIFAGICYGAAAVVLARLTGFWG